jgi:ABC-type transport system substrate-binding protein
MMQDPFSGRRVRRREVLKLIAAGSSASALLALSSAPTLAANQQASATPLTLAQQAGAPGQLTIAWNVSPPNLNPLNAVSLAQWHSFASMYSTLCMADPQNQTYAPDLAQSWDIAPDGSSYTLPPAQ